MPWAPDELTVSSTELRIASLRGNFTFNPDSIVRIVRCGFAPFLWTKRQRAAALAAYVPGLRRAKQDLAEARRPSNRAKRLGVRCPRTAFEWVRWRRKLSTFPERSHPPQSGGCYAGTLSTRWMPLTAHGTISLARTPPPHCEPRLDYDGLAERFVSPNAGRAPS
jgi:hypothetical protein